MIIAMTRAKARPRKQGELLQTILSLLGPIRKEKGCRACHSYLNLEDENDFILVEEWDTQTDFETHASSEEFHVLLGALNVLCTPLEIRAKVFSATERPEAIEQAPDDVVGKDSAI
jgi:quinol monooxygenase YgiN